MARVKLSEYRGKNIISHAFGKKYGGVSIDIESSGWEKQVSKLSPKKLYVCKVDQAVKKRGKNGLVTLGRTPTQLLEDIRDFEKKGFRFVLVEPFVKHAKGTEQYVALTRGETSIDVAYSPKGGIEIESNSHTLQHCKLDEEEFIPAENTTELSNDILSVLYDLFKKNHMTLFEINPFVIENKQILALDAAIEVDSAAEFFTEDWSGSDVREAAASQHPSEAVVAKLNAESPASMNLKVLNENGKYFLLLSGGGASVVIADELSSLDNYEQIANYGEYSGNPTEEETYLYAKEVVKLLLSSKADKKVLMIAGGVANFTDVAKTFSGIISVLQEYSDQLLKQNVKVLVRRGGPNQEAGLSAMRTFLSRLQIENEVHGPELSLAKTVSLAVGSTN